nr:ATP synthase F0 subunit 8 [Dromaeolus sp. ZM-2022]
MSPLNWFLLFIYFSLMLTMIISLNYYSSINTSSQKLTSKISKIMNWKW